MLKLGFIAVLFCCFLGLCQAAVVDTDHPLSAPPKLFIKRLAITTIPLSHQELSGQRLKQQAYAGDALAQAKLGLSYSLGTVESIPANINAAKEWFTRSASQGNACGQYLLGMTLLLTAHNKHEINEGVKWLTQAAEKDNADAQWQLSRLYRADGVLGNNSQQQLLWLQRAVTQQQPYALYDLGRFYLDGRDGTIDLKRAFQYLTAAVNDSGDNDQPRVRNTSAMLLLADGYRTGLWGKVDKNKARYWYQQSSHIWMDDTFADSLIFLKAAEMYANGWGGWKTGRLAIEYYEQAFEFSQAKLALVDLYAYEAEGVYSADKTRAFGVLYLSAQQGNKAAQKRLGESYLLSHQPLLAYYWLLKASHQGVKQADSIIREQICGSSTSAQVSCQPWLARELEIAAPAANYIQCQKLLERDNRAAYDYCERAAEQHFDLAEMSLAHWNFEGNSRPQQSSKEHAQTRFRWLERAAFDGNPQAQYELAEAYHFGVGVERNLSKAMALYNISYRYGRGDALISSEPISWIEYQAQTPEHALMEGYYEQLNSCISSPYSKLTLALK